MSKNSPNNGLINGLVLGGTAGVLLGLILAPRTGKETRQLLKKAATALPEIATDFTDTIQGRTNHQWQGTISRLQRAIAAGIEASRSETPDYSLHQGHRD